jgi:hypothetical protein
VSTLSARATERRHHRTAARIVGTVGVLGAAAAVAGLSTFGNFTYTSGPIDTQVQGGVLSIDVAQAGDGLTMPFGGGLFLAGDSRGYRVDLVNDGDTALSSVSLTSRATSSSVLDTDSTHGLQLDVTSCSTAWTVTNGVYSCAGTQKSVYSGPIVVAGQAMTSAASTTPGQVDHLLMTASLPQSASGDMFEGASSSLEFFFSGVQRTGSAR